MMAGNTRTWMAAMLMCGVLAGCNGSPAPVMMAPQARQPQTRAASLDGFKARLQHLITTDVMPRDRDKNKYLSKEEAGMPALDFSRADKNADNRLDLNEMVAFYLRDLYAPFSQGALIAFKGLDVNGTDNLSLDEFMRTSLAPSANGQPNQPNSLVYRMTDRNRNGFVEFDEFEDLLAWDAVNLMPPTPGPVMPGPAAPPPMAPVTKPPVAPPVTAPPPQAPKLPPQAPGDPPRPEPD